MNYTKSQVGLSEVPFWGTLDLKCKLYVLSTTMSTKA